MKAEGKYIETAAQRRNGRNRKNKPEVEIDPAAVFAVVVVVREAPRSRPPRKYAAEPLLTPDVQ